MSQQNSEVGLWRGALIPAVSVAGASIILGLLIRGSSGLWGAVVASATVIIYFSVHLAIAAISNNLDPIATMALAMLSYCAKIVLMGLLLVVVTRTTSPDSVDRPTFAVAALSITAAWLIGEIRAFLKLRLSLPLPQTKASNVSPASDLKSGE